MYADVALPGTGFKTFTYIIPPKLKSSIRPGVPVMVPLRNHSAVGVVMDTNDECRVQGKKIKEISGLIDPVFMLTPNHLALISWIADYYICPVGDVLKSSFPPEVIGRTRMRVFAGKKIPPEPKWNYVYERIRSKKGGYIYKRKGPIVPGVSNTLINKMVKAGFLYLSVDYRTQKPFTRLIASIKPDIDVSSSRQRLSSRRKELVELLWGYPSGMAISKLMASGFSRALIEAMTKDGFLEIMKKSNDAVVSSENVISSGIVLNADQQKAIKAVSESMENNIPATYLLFGVTNSGKTQVYIEATRKAIALGRSVLILLPEIALTPQAIKRFSEALNCAIGIWHSKVTAAQRVDIYKQAKEGELKVVLGVRSAVFVPLTNLGLVVVDEEQDDSYKQSDPAPRYNARDVALMRAKIEGATAVLGSATPSMESFYNAEIGKYKLLRLPRRCGGGRLPKSYAIDLKNVEVDKKNWPLSEPFIERICSNIADGKQVIILLNRRGYSGLLLCKGCGYIAICPDCRVAMTYHKPGRQLLCHFCGLALKAPTICPECNGVSFDYRGIGTQKLEELLIGILGEKGIIRMDSDSTSRKGALEKIIFTFEVGEKSVLLGTRMVAKGHHFPQVGMVGVVLADAGLHLPDFRASEKVFQLLVQSAGRAGRSDSNIDQGEFVVQTYDPSSGILEFATTQDFEIFYHKELLHRRELGYPPFGKIIRFVFSGHDDSYTRWAAGKSAGEFASNLKTGKVLGPAPTGVFRLGKKYHYQVVLKGKFSADFKNWLKDFIAGGHQWQSKTVNIKVDVDPREMI